MTGCTDLESMYTLPKPQQYFVQNCASSKLIGWFSACQEAVSKHLPALSRVFANMLNNLKNPLYTKNVIAFTTLCTLVVQIILMTL